MLSAYRELDGALKPAARQAGVSVNTLKKAVSVGWPDQGLMPITKVIEQEHNYARAMRTQEQAAEKLVRAQDEAQAIVDAARAQAAQLTGELVQEHARARQDADQRVRAEEARLREAAKLDALDQAADEARLSIFNRKNALQLQAFIARLGQQVLKPLSDAATAWIAGGQMSFGQLMQFMRTYAYAQKAASEVSLLSLEQERLRVGDPTSIVEIRGEPKDLEDIERQHAEAAVLLDVARRRLRPAVVADGGSNGSNGKVN